MRVIQKFFNNIQILDLLHNSHLCMGLKTEIWRGFSSFIRNGSIFFQVEALNFF